MPNKDLADFSTEELKTELAKRKDAERYERKKAKNPERCETCIHFRAIKTAFNIMTECYRTEPTDVEFDKKACKYFQYNNGEVIWIE